MEFILSLDVETVFNPNSMIMLSKHHEVSFKLSSCMRSKTLSVMQLVNFAYSMIVSSSLGSSSFSFNIRAPLSHGYPC